MGDVILDLKEIKLDKSIPTPLYFQLKQQLLKKINDHELKVDDQIPHEIDMVDELEISRSTVRQAISELVSEGYLYRVRAKGTFVSTPKVDENFFQQLDSFNNEMIKKGMKPSTKILKFHKEEGRENINSKLSIDPSEELIHLSRLRFANDQPVVIVDTYLPYEKFKDLLTEDLSEQSLYSLIEEKYDTKIVRAKREIEAVIAKANEKKLLNIKSNAAVCLVKTTAYAENDIPVEYSIARYTGDRNRFIVELKRYK